MWSLGQDGERGFLRPSTFQEDSAGGGDSAGSVGGTPRGHCSTVGPRAGDGRAVSSLPGWPLSGPIFLCLALPGPNRQESVLAGGQGSPRNLCDIGHFLNQLYRPVLWSRGWSNPDPCGGNTCVHKRGTLRTEPGKGLALCKRWL